MNDPAREYRRQQMRDMEELLPRARVELRGYPGVVRVTVGAKEVRGCATTQPAFQVYVARKRPSAELGASERIPERLLDYPTDVIEETVGQAIVDEETYRPLAGGTELDQKGSNGGTLGLIALATAGGDAPDGDPVILSNHHVIPHVGELVGQPSDPSECWCCQCCDVGRVVTSSVTGTVGGAAPTGPTIDAAIATLSEGERYSHYIVELGYVRGWISATTMTPGDPVFKRGRTTELTEGRFSTATDSPSIGGYADGTTRGFTNQIRITGATPGAPFALGGDSGSVVVDAQNRVIGLLFGSTIPAGAPSWANRIEDVMSLMHIDIPVMGTAGAAMIAGHGTGTTQRRDVVRQEWTATVARLRETEAGRQWAALAERHAEEVADLVRRDRATTVAWQRAQGPAFVGHYLNTLRESGYQAPEEIVGVRPENLLLSMFAVLRDRGSPALADAVGANYLAALELTRGCRRVDDVIARLEARSGALPAAVGTGMP
jgi:hypothetical protein